jgi:tripartite-type tricarboxylate transporter receptor subunit TctC
MAGVNITHVPYKGSAPALTALMGGEVNVLFSDMLAVTPQLGSGKVRALAVTTARRSALAPDLPTIAETGLAGYDVYVWYGLLAPAKTPKAVIARLNTEVVEALNNQEVKDQFARSGSTAASSTTAGFDAVIKRDYDVWARVIKGAGIKLE